MRTWRWVVAGLAVTVTGAVAWTLVQKWNKPAKPAPAALEFLSTEVTSPSLTTLEQVIEFSGPLVAPSTAMVRAKAGGTLLQWQVAEGGRVRAGQLLATLDVSDLSSRVAERGALLESARATLVQAERAHAQNESLAAQKFISGAALEASRAALDSARAQVAAAEASLNSIRVGLRDAALVAPISGIVAKRHAVAGEKVTSEQQLATLVDLATLELAGMVGTHEVSRLTPGMPAELQIEGVGSSIKGRIARIAPAAEAGTRSVGVTVTVDNPGEVLRAGQYGMVRVAIADSQPRQTLPANAIVMVAGHPHAWVLEAGTLRRRAVTIGRKDVGSGQVEIIDPLPPETVVLAARFDNLREGSKAAVVAATGAAPSASGPQR